MWTVTLRMESLWYLAAGNNRNDTKEHPDRCDKYKGHLCKHEVGLGIFGMGICTRSSLPGSKMTPSNAMVQFHQCVWVRFPHAPATILDVNNLIARMCISHDFLCHHAGACYV